MASTPVPSNVSVVVVSFNTKEKLRRCLAAIEPEHEVIVVDNASVDGSAEMVQAEFPHVRLIVNAKNVGFGAANNQGMAVATRELVLLLNSDCYADRGAIARLAEDFQYEGVVAAGGKLENPDGSLQESVAGRLTLLAVLLEQLLIEKLLSKPGLGYWQTNAALTRWASSPGVSLDRQPWERRAVEVHQVMGACLMMRPVERFDERFFLYCEDTELCHRLRRHGKIVYCPEAAFTHELGSSSKRDPWRGVALYNRGKELYFAIHRGPLAMAFCWILNRLGALLRLLIWLLPTMITLGTQRRFRDQVVLFWKVLTSPLRGPHRPTRTSG